MFSYESITLKAGDLVLTQLEIKHRLADNSYCMQTVLFFSHVLEILIAENSPTCEPIKLRRAAPMSSSWL